jgi:hypothetical protein
MIVSNSWTIVEKIPGRFRKDIFVVAMEMRFFKRMVKLWMSDWVPMVFP